MTEHIRRGTRLLIVTAALVATALALVACPAQQPRTLRVWQTETDRNAVAALGETIAAFEAAHPGVKVELESVAWSSLSNKLSAALQAQNEPDVAHLEPFMAASLVRQDLLLPLDDEVIAPLEKANGPISKSVRDLQLFDGRRYGIAYAVGTTGWAYRKDLADKAGLQPPGTWKEYIAFVSALQKVSGGGSVIIPGGDPFFVDQLFAELVANNGGTLFDPQTYRPRLDTKPVLEVLEFFQQLAPMVDRGWQSQAYLDQFSRFGRGEAVAVPVSYARAARAIENVTATGGTTGAKLQPSPAVFAWMEQPRGPSYSGPPLATIDCEPYVVFKASEARGTKELAFDFLNTFFARDRYLRFVGAVPVHLTPIFEPLVNDADYQSNPFLVQWKPWADQTARLLSEGRVRPILMPDVSNEGRTLPFLLEFQAAKILTQSVADVLKGAAPKDAAAEAQRRAEALLTSLRFKRW